MAKIDNEKLTAAKKTLRAEIEERRLQTFTPTDAVEDLRTEILDMAAVGYSIEEIEARLKAVLGLKRVPMSRVRKILRENAIAKVLEIFGIQDAQEAPVESAEPERKEAPAPEAAKSVPPAPPAISNAVSAVKESLAAGLENLQPAPPITSAATVPPPQPAVGKKEVQDGTGNGTRLPEGGG